MTAIDRAFAALRARIVAPPPRELEKRVLARVTVREPVVRLRWHRAVACAFAALVLGGGLFAAVGWLRSWIVEVQVDGGGSRTIEVGPDGSGRIDFETKDGRGAAEFEHSDLPDGGERTRLRVTSRSGDGMRREVEAHEQAIGGGRVDAPPPAHAALTAPAIATWRDDDGAESELVALPRAAGGHWLYERARGGARFLARSRMPVGAHVRIAVRPTADGGLHVEARDRRGSSWSLRVAAGRGRSDPGDGMNVETRDGAVRATARPTRSGGRR